MGLRIALFGQAPVAVDCLDRLIEASHQVVGVFAPADSGRPDALATRSEELGLPTFRRQYFRKKSGEPIPAALESYRQLDAELNVLASLTVFLPREILDAPRHRSICFHPSLLPRYRGGNAMQWQIIEGECEVGVSIFVPDDGADTGPVLVQRRGVKIDPTDTTGSLFFTKLGPLGVEALMEAVERIAAGEAQPVAQDETGASHQGLVDDVVARVDLDRDAEEIDRLVRGCDPQPGAWLKAGATVVRLYDAFLETYTDEPSAPGTILRVDEDGWHIALRGGVLRVGRVRGEAGKEAAAAFSARTGVAAGSVLESG